MNSKSSYETPEVVVHGSFEDMTQKMSGFSDGTIYTISPGNNINIGS